MELAEYSACDATQLALLVQREEVSPEQIRRCALEAIAAVNPAVNAVVEVYEEPSVVTVSSGQQAFRGVPMLLKDMSCYEAGRKCEWGSRLAKGFVARADSDLMRLFRNIGLINLGRSATSEFGLAATVETALNGRTRNPWDLTRTAGGSSGGAAAAVASGMVPIAHGTDGGGSIRIPAALCGLVGLKPSNGALGVSTRTPNIEQLQGDFFLVRSVRDAINLFSALRGDAPEAAPTTRDMPRSSAQQKTVLFTSADGDSEVPDEIEDAVEQIAQLLSELGYAVAPAPALPETNDLLAALEVIWSHATAHIVSKVEHWTGRTATLHTLEQPTLARVRAGHDLDTRQIAGALTTLQQFRAEMERVSSTCDFLLSPTVPVATPPLGLYDPATATDSGAYYGSAIARLEALTTQFNTSGQPAISLPLARSSEGLPIGLQIAGRQGADYDLLALSAALEQAMPWQSVRPVVYAGQAT